MRKRKNGRKVDKSEVAHALMDLVGGTDTIQEVPITFREAWDHHDETERILWREAIRKEFHDMIVRGIWRYHKTNKVPSERILIGTK